MEFEEVRNLLRHGRLEDASLSTHSLDQRLHRSFHVDSYRLASVGSSLDNQQPTLKRRKTDIGVRMHSPAQGVSRLVNTLLGVKQPKERDEYERPLRTLSPGSDGTRYLSRTSVPDIRHSYEVELHPSSSRGLPTTNFARPQADPRQNEGVTRYNRSRQRNTPINHSSGKQSYGYSSSDHDQAIDRMKHRNINRQTQTFDVPNDWQSLGDTRSSIFNPNDSTTDLAKVLLLHLQEEVERYEHLTRFTKKNIETLEGEIMGYTVKLLEFDEAIEDLKNSIAHARKERIKAMTTILYAAQKQQSGLQKTHQLHKHITANIANYNSIRNPEASLAALSVKVNEARYLELLWRRTKHAGLLALLHIFLVLVFIWHWTS